MHLNISKHKIKYTQWVNDMEVGLGMLFDFKQIDEESEKNALERLTKTNLTLQLLILKKIRLLAI